LAQRGFCGFATLRHCLEVGHTCIALCRTPSKLSDKLPSSLLDKLRIEEGNAHDLSAVARCLTNPSSPNHSVDMVISAIGNPINLRTFSIADPHVCEKGAETLLEALSRVRKDGVTGNPRIIALSTTGITDAGRDVPVLNIPLYHILLRVPHKDKKVLEDLLVASGEQWTTVRPSLLTDGPEFGNIRVGVEDVAAREVEKSEIGYTISREDVGKWIFENLVHETDARWVRKAASITY
jgi:nucleoside-diphosphate-sugar epimerase